MIAFRSLGERSARGGRGSAAACGAARDAAVAYVNTCAPTSSAALLESEQAHTVPAGEHYEDRSSRAQARFLH
jgi:hypothetical protein